MDGPGLGEELDESGDRKVISWLQLLSIPMSWHKAGSIEHGGYRNRKVRIKKRKAAWVHSICIFGIANCHVN